MPLRIVAKREGFWRCGVQHSTMAKIYPDGFFTPEQVARLKAEPMLIVDELPAEDGKAQEADDKAPEVKDEPKKPSRRGAGE